MINHIFGFGSSLQRSKRLESREYSTTKIPISGRFRSASQSCDEECSDSGPLRSKLWTRYGLEHHIFRKQNASAWHSSFIFTDGLQNFSRIAGG